MKNKIPPPLILIFFGVIMWLVAKSSYAIHVEPPLKNIVASMFVFSGSVVIAVAMIQFRRARTTINPLSPESATWLVSGGIFQYSRNPMYLGMLLILIGFAYRLGSLANIAVLALFVTTINTLQIRPEEEALAELFGNEFEAYRKAVRRWI